METFVFNVLLELNGECTQNMCVQVCVVELTDTAVTQHMSFSRVDVIDIIYLA